MNTYSIFREIDSLISVVEAMQHDLSSSTFDTMKIVADEVPYFRLERVRSLVESKSDSFFQFARTLNRKAERFSGSYVEFIKPASRGAYIPVGIDVDNV
ncbi:hypothetical protein FDP08_07730 [Marinobacter panjinensis]|uniref:Uncharacterized protein n=1 Tax=Marinobacter panjinensis TaxID=2576384 RepID=A0A4U6R2Z0_9GAMM|nr:hypothetical protein [Marinobacter panjinensis]MCR8913334.1 hypothetical protein [Marinobacter panjinensis]TKV67997.1 hypothetical protein FDP08_07730 [Marinobacter panjinensis]